MGRTGLVVLAIVLIFAAAVAAFSFFTSRTIVRPIQKIARGRGRHCRWQSGLSDRL